MNIVCDKIVKWISEVIIFSMGGEVLLVYNVNTMNIINLVVQIIEGLLYCNH